MNRVPVFRPTVRRDEMDSVLGCLVTDEIGHGDRARELAAAVAGALGMAGGIALADYRMALACAVTTIDVPGGSRVLCSALAPRAHRDAVEASGMVPVVVDVSADSGVMDLDAADEAVGVGDEDGGGERVVLGLGNEIGGTEGGVGGLVGDDHGLGRAEYTVDVHTALDELLGIGNENVAGAADLVDLGY